MAERSETFTIEKSLIGERLDTFLRARYPAVSRGTIQRLIEQGHIRVNGAPVKPTHTPRAGEVVSVFWPDPRPAEARPEDIPLEVLYEDDDLLVLNKASGIVVHPAAGNERGTLVNALLHHCAGQLSGIGGVARPGIVHRLDKDTSGCLAVAKSDTAHLKLAAQFAGRDVVKIYEAILCGELSRDKGEIQCADRTSPDAPQTHGPGRRRTRSLDELQSSGTSARRDTGGSSIAHGPHAPDSRSFPAHRISARRRRHLWETTQCAFA
jgi:23S rRNA pseudouridine1911/1915/1917 synthase